MNNKRNSKEKIIGYCIWGVFIIYSLLLIRIVFFKQVKLNNLLAAIGASERTINISPSVSVFEMIQKGISATRIFENVLGNIFLFIPLGILLPILMKKNGKSILLYGICVSLSIEIIQFIFGLGSTDIDDLIFNAIGVLIGYLLFHFIKSKTKSHFSLITSTFVVLVVVGILGTGYLIVNNTDLFMVSSKNVTIENGDLVQDFIQNKSFLSGKFIEFNNPILTVEKAVNSANEKREIINMEIASDSLIYLCYYKIDYFFGSVSGENLRYEQIDYSNFISHETKQFSKNNNVQIWSSNEKTIDFIIITEWIE